MDQKNENFGEENQIPLPAYPFDEVDSPMGDKPKLFTNISLNTSGPDSLERGEQVSRDKQGAVRRQWKTLLIFAILVLALVIPASIAAILLVKADHNNAKGNVAALSDIITTKTRAPLTSTVTLAARNTDATPAQETHLDLNFVTER